MLVIHGQLIFARMGISFENSEGDQISSSMGVVMNFGA